MLSAKQARFVAEYLIDLNGKQAAIRTGYAPKSAEVTASVLLRDPKVRAALAEGQAKHLAATDLSATRVLEELRRLAFSDASRLFDAEGNLKPLGTLTPEDSAALASVEVIVKNAQAGDGHTDTVHKIRLWDKTKALDMLAKHLGLLKERVDHEGTVTFAWADE